MTPSQNSLPGRALVNESEISGLIEWSLPWVKGLAAVSFLVGLQGVVMAVREMADGAAREAVLWQFMHASAGITLGSCLFSFSRQGARFVGDPEKQPLGEVMVALSVVLGVLFFTQVALVFSLCSNLADALLVNRTYRLSPYTFFLCGYAALSGPLMALVSDRFEKKQPYATGDFLKNINPFATRLLPMLRYFSVFAIAGGLLVIGFGIADYLYEVTDGATRVLGSGIVLTALGAAIQWYRRAVRDIQRNPTPYFFERTLNRLNLLWLLSTVFFAVLFVVGFF